jgi:hypothetical protein
MSSGQYSTVEEVAKFLHNAQGLNKVKLGDVLGEQYVSKLMDSHSGFARQDLSREPNLTTLPIRNRSDDFHVRLLHAFITHMDFTGMEFDLALRLFLSKFRLPGEAQKIDRIMESYARHYTTQNPTVFPNEGMHMTVVTTSDTHTHTHTHTHSLSLSGAANTAKINSTDWLM